MLAAQIATTHALVMECFRRANVNAEDFEIFTTHLGHAARLSSLSMKQMAGFEKSQGKGEHKVVVERVHVNAGG
jgi:hypothetical protein